MLASARREYRTNDLFCLIPTLPLMRIRGRRGGVRLSVRYRLSQETLAGTRGNGRDAPIADVSRGGMPLASSTDLQRTFDAASTWLVPIA